MVKKGYKTQVIFLLFLGRRIQSKEETENESLGEAKSQGIMFSGIDC